jgi:hypothetical protein
MTRRDLATVALKTLSAWLFASGVAGLGSALLTWSHDVAQYGTEGGILGAAAAGILIPIGALGWIASDWAAGRIFRDAPAHGIAAPGLTRADLYASGSVLVGLCLLANAVPMIVYWAVVGVISRGTGFWSAAAGRTGENDIVYWVSVRAGVGRIATEALLGILFVLGPERVARGVQRIRKEFSSHLTEPDDHSSERPGGGRDGGA